MDMRLLDTETGQFVEKDPEDRKTVYAILSHMWDKEGEQTYYKELKKIQRRYAAGLQAQQSHRMSPEGGASSFPDSKHDRRGSPPKAPPPQPTSDPSSLTTCPPTALRCLTQSDEVEALFNEVYALVSPTLLLTIISFKPRNTN